MRFYSQQHQYYCGIDLHARSMYLCMLDQAGQVLVHRNMRANRGTFRKAVAPYREELACYDQLLRDLECFILRTAKEHDHTTLYRLRTVPGIGNILSLVILYLATEGIGRARRLTRPHGPTPT